MLSRRAGLSATAELSCLLLVDHHCILTMAVRHFDFQVTRISSKLVNQILLQEMFNIVAKLITPREIYSQIILH